MYEESGRCAISRRATRWRVSERSFGHIVGEFAAEGPRSFAMMRVMKARHGSMGGMAAVAGVLGLVLLSLGTPDGCGAPSEDLIGSEGGVLRSDDGRFTLEIPPDALSTEVEIAVREVDCDQEGAAACYDVSPTGLTFRTPAIATYEAADLMSMESLSLIVQGDEGWQPLADFAVDREDATITASVLYLSTFSVQAN
jgi:hypothetical protein